MGDAALGYHEVVQAQVEVEQVHVPGGLEGALDVGLHDGPGDGQGGVLGVVVDVAIAGLAELGVFLFQEAAEEGLGEGLPLDAARLGIGLGEQGALVDPLPEDGQADLARGHVLHEVEDVVVAEEVRRLQRGGLEAPQEGIAVLQGHGEQVPGAGDGARSGLEQHETGGIRGSIGQGREGSAQLVGLAHLLPHRPDDVDHLPVGHPLAGGTLALLTLGPGHGPLHAGGHALGRAHGDVGFHAALPEGTAAVAIRRVHGPADAILVVAHVAVGHGDGLDVGIDELLVPGQRVRDTVDVVPAAGVEAHEVRGQGGADLHELEALLQLLHQHVALDGAHGQAQVGFQGQDEAVPQGRVLGGLGLGQVDDDAAARGEEALVVVHHEQHQVREGGREAVAVLADVPVIQVQAPAAEDDGGEVQLLTPVGDDGPPEEALGPGVHLPGHLLGDLQEERIPVDGQLEVAVVVQGHGVHLAQGVLAVEHPAVGAGEQRVGHVADARAHIRARLGGGTRTLDPLALEVRGDDGAVEVAGPGVGHLDLGPRDEGLGIQEADPLTLPRAPLAQGGAGRHPLVAAVVEGRQHLQGRQGRRGVDIGIGRQDRVAEFQGEGHF